MHLATNSLGKILQHTQHRPQTLLEELREARYDLTQAIPGSFLGLDDLTPYSEPESNVSKPSNKTPAHSKLNSEEEVNLILASDQNQQPMPRGITTQSRAWLLAQQQWQQSESPSTMALKARNPQPTASQPRQRTPSPVPSPVTSALTSLRATPQAQTPQRAPPPAGITASLASVTPPAPQASTSATRPSPPAPRTTQATPAAPPATQLRTFPSLPPLQLVLPVLAPPPPPRMVYVDLPQRGERAAPCFDRKAKELSQYFSEVEVLYTRHGINDDQEKKSRAIKYLVSTALEMMWRSSNTLGDITKTYNEFRAEMYKLYPGLSDNVYTVHCLDVLVGQCARLGVKSMAKLGEFHLQFRAILKYLISKNWMLKAKQTRSFLQGLQPELESQVKNQLQIIKQNHDLEDPYDLTDLYKAASFVLKGSMPLASLNYAPLAPVVAQPKVKTKAHTKIQVLKSVFAVLTETFKNLLYHDHGHVISFSSLSVSFLPLLCPFPLMFQYVPDCSGIFQALPVHSILSHSFLWCSRLFWHTIERHGIIWNLLVSSYISWLMLCDHVLYK